MWSSPTCSTCRDGGASSAASTAWSSRSTRWGRHGSASWATRPVELATAALWAFVDDREAEIEVVAAAGLPCHVLWAERDTVLSRADGREFAERLHADFTVAARPPGYGPIDHDWMFDDPELFAAHLDRLGLQALTRD